jgi:plastocyanin
MPGPRAGTLALALFALLLLAGCSRTEDVGANRTLSVAISEYRLNPPRARVATGTLTIYVHNFGRLTHNLVIGQSGRKEAGTATIWPGQSTELTVDLPPGTYSLTSTILSDQVLGVYGTLVVTK